MKERCPDAELVDKAKLENYKLAFTIYSPKRKCGCADILSSKGSIVWGLLYKLNEGDIFNLDRFEGSPIHYRRISIEVQNSEANLIRAETYEVVNKEKYFQAPSADYLGKIINAAIKYSFPKIYRDFLKKIPTLKKSF